jgi:hypothetical protein
MNSKANIPSLERITFFTGQRLTATDLSELQRAHRELRWLHNRSLHGWGIGIGLAVQGERGDSAVTIGPGYAVDCLGREIILTESQTKTVPAVAHGPDQDEAIFYLIAAYQENEDQAVTERRPGVCLPEGTVRLSETPRLDWRQPEQLQEGLELILAQAWVQNCRLSRPLCLLPRRNARPSQRPYIAAGQTRVGDTPWNLSSGGDEPQSVSTYVDTSAARFRATPHYFAHVVGSRFLAEPPGPLIVASVPTTLDPTPQGFTMQMFVLEPLEQLVEAINKLNWYVVWMGIEG